MEKQNRCTVINDPNIIAGGYVGIALTEEDLATYQKRIGSNCFVLKKAKYDRNQKQIISDDTVYVLDFHDGEYVNFKIKQQ